MITSIERCDLWLADFYLLTSVLLLAVLAVQWISEQPARRLAVAKSAIIAVFLLVLLRTVPGWSLVHLWMRERPALESSIAATRPPDSLLALTQDGATLAPQPRRETSPNHIDMDRGKFAAWPAVTWPTVVVLSYATGAVGVFAWLSFGMLAARRLRRATQLAPDELIHMLAQLSSPPFQGGVRGGFFPDLRTSHHIQVPVAIGIRRPTIILPAEWLSDRTADDLRTILAHELAHIQSGDLRWLAIGRALLILLWAQPLYWLLRRQMRVDQEVLADAAAAELAGRQQYAEQLVAWARTIPARPRHALPAAVGLWEGPSQLRRRVAILLNDRLTLLRNCSRTWRLAATALCISAAACLSLITLQPASRAEPEHTPSASAQNIPANDSEALPAQNSQQPTKDTPAAQPLSFSGTVVDSHTKLPIAGAEVAVRRMILHSTGNEILEESHHTTNALGVYQFVIPPEQAAEPHLYIELGVRHPGHVPRPVLGYSFSMIQKNQKLGEQPFFTSIELSPSDAVTGRVLDPSGQPLAGVRIRGFTIAKKGDQDDWETSSWQLVDTNADGRFSIDAVDGGPCIVWIVPDEFAPRQIVLSAKHGDQGDIRVEPGISLRGRVVGESGEPVPGVWVNLEDRTASAEIKMPVTSSVCRTDMTDKDGQFKLGPIKAGPCSLRIDDSPREVKYEDRRGISVPVKDVFVEQDIDLGPADENQPITIRALQHVDVHGHFVDSQGKPTSGWQIDVFGRIDNQSFFATWEPDRQGEFTGRLPRGLQEGRVKAFTNEHHSLRIRLKPDGPLGNPRDTKLGVVDADFPDIQIVKYTSPIVQIAVVDQQGHVVSGAHVAGVYDNGDELILPVGEPPTHVFFEKQADGRFRTSQMLPDVKTTFTATADGYDDASESLTLPEAAERQLPLVMKRHVHDGNGKNTDNIKRPKNIKSN